MITKITLIAVGVLLSFFNISTTDSYSFLQKGAFENGNKEEKINTIKYRLPTKTEWEYALLTCPPIINDIFIYEDESKNSFNYRLPTKTEWEHALQTCPPTSIDIIIYEDEPKKSFNYRLPTKTEWEHAIKNRF